MADTPHPPTNGIIRWIDHRLPFVALLRHELYDYPTPRNLSYWWNFGSLAGIMLVVMIVTGIFLAMQYTPSAAARLRLGRAHHARRQLRLADALRARQRRVDVLCNRLHPYFPGTLLRLLQGAARIAVDPWGDHPDIDDSDRVHGIRAALGADELLGRHRDYQSVFGDPARGPQHRHIPVGRLYRWRSDPAPLLCAALSAAVRDPVGRAAAPRRAPPLRLQQSAGHRHEGPAGTRSHSILITRSRICSGCVYFS